MRTSSASSLMLFLSILSSSICFADLIHLRNGDTLDGEVLDDSGDAYRVRTTMGVSDIEKAQVFRIEKKDPPWVRYEKEKASLVDSAQGHLRLAQWCRKADMRTEEKYHLQEVLRHDPDHAEARRLLGFIKKDGQWVKPKAPRAPSAEELAARKKFKRDEKLIADTIAEYTVKVKAIHRGRLTPKSQDDKGNAFAEGRQKILELHDPLAIPALTAVLSTGDAAARMLLVEALAQFQQDESTMNLLVIGLLDPSADVRKVAGEIVARRKDIRIIEQLRRALTSDEEFILRNAATMLGLMKAREAVPDLIAVLLTETVAPVRISRWVTLDAIYGGFSSEQQYYVTGFPVLYRPSWIGSLGPGTNVGTLTSYEMQVVRVHRTEVQDALIAITGENLGFEREAWLAWAKKHGP